MRKLCDKKFLKRVKDSHAENYIIDDIIYKGMAKPVFPTCRKHGKFSIRAQHFANGVGCKKCHDESKVKIVTRDAFIRDSIEIHGDRYDYSLVKDSRISGKVRIICKEHGEYLQNVKSHLGGRNCPKCRNYHNRLTTDEFINRAKKKHGDRYNYSLTNYTTSNHKVKIICNIHGKFEKAPFEHLNGGGCPKCSDRRSNNLEFKEKSTKIHGNIYDYSLVDYINSNTKVKIICEEHGIFEQTPDKHLSGSGCRLCGIDKSAQLKVSSTEEFIDKANKIHGDRYNYSLVEYDQYNLKVKIICKTHGEFDQIPNSHLNGSGCPACGCITSKQELFVEDILRIGNVEFSRDCRDIITPLELDFYLPDHNLAIECNGLYWHSELWGKDKNYHLNKTNLCRDSGIRLIHIFEDEINNKPDIIKSKLNSILNINKRKLYGRKCEVREIDSKLKSKFLDKYHLQGNDKSSINLGLFYNNKLVSVMTFSKRRLALGKNLTEEGEYELSRFCGNFHFYIIGGASKLLKYFERKYKPSKIITYADKRWSEGGVYFKLGFTHTHDSKPSYWYIKSNKRIHRFNFRKSELSKKLEVFDSKLTEWENMKNNGWSRIWDCGNMVFELAF